MIDIPRLLAELYRWVGVPFRHQGRTRSGVDCAGLLLAGLAEQGVHVSAPANYHPSAAATLLLAELEASPLFEPRNGPPERGDVLVFRIRRAAQHLAIALGSDAMIHATRDGVNAVTIGPLWRQRLVQRYGWR